MGHFQTSLRSCGSVSSRKGWYIPVCLPRYDRTSTVTKHPHIHREMPNRNEANLVEQYRIQETFLDACTKGDLDTVQRLLAHPKVDPAGGEKGTFWYQEPIKFASRNGHTDVVRVLLQDPRVDPTNVPLEPIAGRGHTGVLQLLLQDGRADPSKHDMMTLQVACFDGHPDIVQLLLQDPRVNPFRIREVLIGETIRRGQMEVVKRLLADPRVNPRITNQTAKILETIPVRELEPVVARYPYEFEQLLTSVEHLIDKKRIRLAARNILSLKRTGKGTIGNLPNDIQKHVGSLLSGKVGPNLQSQINQLNVNRYGPKTQRTRTRKKVRG